MIVNRYHEVIRYVIVGILTTIVSIGSYWICVMTVLNPAKPFELQIANVISWICAVLFAYITNRRYVFKSTNDDKIKELISFLISRLSTLFIDMFFMYLLVSVLLVNDKTSKLIVQIIIFILNYLFSKFIVFKDIKRHKMK